MVDFAQLRSFSIVKPIRDAPMEVTLLESMGVSGATWTRRLRDALDRNRCSLFAMRLPSPCTMQLLGGGGGEPAWGYCG